MKSQSFFRFLLVTLLVAITYLSLTPVTIPLVENVWDKLNHVVAFFALSFAVDFSFPNRRYGPAKALSLLAYGLGIELLQRSTPNRFFELGDLLADAVGLLIYGVLILAVPRLAPLRGRGRS